jgi:hypothetical protein
MPWWNLPCGGSDRCAANFASAVGTSLGLPNENVVFGLPSGPLFAYDTYYSNSPNTQPNKLNYIFNPISEPNYPRRTESEGVLDIGINGDIVRTWAQVTLVPAAGSPAAVPGPCQSLALLLPSASVASSGSASSSIKEPAISLPHQMPDR